MTTAVSVAGAIDTLNDQTQPLTASKTTKAKDMSNESKHSTKENTLTGSNDSNANRIPLNPLLSEFIDCIENLPGRLQLLLSELRNVDAEVNLRHKKLQLIKQQILSNTIAAAKNSLAQSDCSSKSSSSSYSEILITDTTQIPNSSNQTDSKMTIKQLLNSLHQILLQCQLLGDQKVKITGQIMEILSNKTRRLGLDTKSHEERNFQVELDEEKIVSEFKIAIKKRSMHAKKNSLVNGGPGPSNSSRVSSRHHTNSIHLQTGSNKTKQQHLNSAEINKVVAKYTKTFTGNNGNNSVIGKFISFASSSRNPLDAYSFDNEDQQIDTIYNKGNKNIEHVEEMKSLRSLNNLINGTGSKKGGLRSKYVMDTKINGNVNNKKPSNKKLRDLNLQYVPSSPRSKSSKVVDISSQSLNIRPKRHLNYNHNNLDSKFDTVSASLNKKRRLNQLKSNKYTNQTASESPLSLNMSNDSTLNQYFNSPSSSSTSSMNTSKLKNSHNINQKIATNKLLNSKTVKLKQKPVGIKIMKKNKKSNSKSGYISRRSINSNNHSNRSIENQDDADDDLSNDDELDEFSANQFDSDNENDEDTDIENRQFRRKSTMHQAGKKHESRKSADGATSENDMNSNETESINGLDEFNNSEDVDNQENDDGNNSNMDKEDEETDEENYRNNKKLKGLNYNKNYESYDEENSENENTKNNNNFNSKSSSKVKTTRIKSLLYRQQKASNNKPNINNMHMDFPVEPSEPIYCICSEISYGQMICCDNDACEIEWFHFECVKLTSKPKGKWYCPHCRGDSHKVMKKFTNHNTTNTSAPANANYSYTNSSVRAK